MSTDPKPQGPEKQTEPGGKTPLPTRNFFAIMMLVLLTLLLLNLAGAKRGNAKTVPYKPDFVQLVESDQIETAKVGTDGAGGYFVEATLKTRDEAGDPRMVRVDIMLHDENLKWMEEKIPGLEYDRPNTMLNSLLWNVLPLVLLFGLVYFLFIRQMRSAGRGAMSFGKSKAKLLTRDKNKVTFKDVAGVKEAEEEVGEVIEFLRDPKKFQKLGGHLPKGVLLSGPPGTGKTLLAKAIAGEAEVPFFSISGSDFVEMFVGVGASRVRDMFEQGRRNAPCIIFIDEIDAVGRSRFSGMGGGHDEREQTLNALLVEMDGFDTQEGVIIVAATNRPDVLDDALLRPGRFDRQIMVDLPPLEGRVDILKIHSSKIKLDEEVDLTVVARGTPGFSGADLANLVNEAALLAARRNGESVESCDLEEARDKVCFGRERRSRVMSEEEKTLTAYHEAGHAIVMELLEHSEPVHKVTIIPRGSSLGSTMQLPEKDEYTQSKRKLEGMLVSFMGGRAAEEIALDDITTGASNDIERATQIAHAMVCRFGMNSEMGPQAFGNNEEHLWMGREVARSQNISESSAQRIDQEVSGLLKRSYEEAMNILTAKRMELETMAKILLEQETIDGKDVHDIVTENRILSKEERNERDGIVTELPEEAPETSETPDALEAPDEEDGSDITPDSSEPTPA